jgi:hypothetical protein
MQGAIAYIGVADHAGWAVTVAADDTGAVLDRRKVDLKDNSLPALPHHNESKRLALAAAVDVVEQVRRSARLHAQSCLRELEEALAVPIRSIALRAIPNLPDTVAERITDYWANARADGAMYREELARAAQERGWAVYWFDKREANELAQTEAFGEAEAAASRRFAPPWSNDHRLALAAALAASAVKQQEDGPWLATTAA